ncbi:hypothetical protein GGX14DRAFT_610142 [Mycena pura]|uniref:Uncharacterized protein n=1 Tax=Mycena pura TaxID=153505 RepID=A0AAD6YEF6_9AGAR|nr:hypothetical protein GGX14DRAFT_610142 [Mycena pura]
MPLAPAFPPSHKPAPLKVALAGIKRTGRRRPASTPDCTFRTDRLQVQVAPPREDATDTWHDTSAIQPGPSLNTKVPIIITYNPTHGSGLVGVALTELLCDGATVRFVLEWSGYHNTRTFPLDSQDDQGRYTTRTGFGQQIARAVYVFMKHFGDSDPFTPREGCIRLGLTGIRFERLRLLKAISVNGQDFYMRLGVVPPPGHTAA